MATIETAANTSNKFTFKGNRENTRYGWLRLTPAYSLHLVNELLDNHAAGGIVLDPFCGTGTTALACAERGIQCDTTDINPFLIWLAQTKSRTYSDAEVADFRSAAKYIINAIQDTNTHAEWLPPLFQIEKWWDQPVLHALGRIIKEIKNRTAGMTANSTDLLKIAFCRIIIESAHVSFGHQSMSFKKRDEEGNGNGTFNFTPRMEDRIIEHWQHAVESISSAAQTLILTQPRAILCDARDLTTALEPARYSCVITSPPYPNRMSYIRELRPYLYWLEYLRNQRSASDLDWLAIGGTWGSATSNVGKWQPEQDVPIPYHGFDRILKSVAHKSQLLSRYIHKYFYDMVFHCRSLFTVVRPGGSINYIVGNSKFYDTVLPVEEIFAALFESVRFEKARVQKIRKRSSKKELFEFVVSAYKPQG